MKENYLLKEFIQDIYTDEFAKAEKTLRSACEEKIKNRMKREMQSDQQEK